MLSAASSDKNILEHPAHIIQEIIKETKRKLATTEHKLLEEFLTNREILIDHQHKDNKYSKTEKLEIYKGTKTLLEHFRHYKNNNPKLLTEDIEMENNSPNPKMYAESDIMQLLTALLQQQQSQQQTTTPSLHNQVRIPTPATYDGTRDVTKIDNWYTSVEHYLKFYDFQKSRWVSYAISLLTDHARLWYYRIKNNYDLDTWETFKAHMDIEFKPRYTLQSTRDKLFELKQTSSVQQYIQDFQNILLELNIAEDEAMDKFSRGLKDKARAHVLLKDPIDLEGMYQCARTYESATQYGHQTYQNSSSSTNTIDDPMDLSVAELKQQNQLLLNLLNKQKPNQFNNKTTNSFTCYYCNKVGHKKNECRNKKWDEGRGIFQSKRPTNGYRTQPPRSNYHNNQNQQSGNFRQQLNALLDAYDPLRNHSDNNNNTNSSSFSTANHSDNKSLIDLSNFDSQDSYLYPALKPKPCPETDTASSKLPLYKAMVGGSDFKVLIDSGASTNYVHPKLISHALTENEVQNQAVETADGTN
ncbi:hypothetical protein INT47_011398 [Mucor saturninus]|uniref:CCHC-type domain-containing protein n=1 Tax=Mucor saturninus TaxID=64648 RepID=A0A8H7UTJ4_9FUNG|nr:hypothetical protein INT47_011398 [Mucor saturninus]